MRHRDAVCLAFSAMLLTDPRDPQHPLWWSGLLRSLIPTTSSALRISTACFMMSAVTNAVSYVIRAACSPTFNAHRKPRSPTDGQRTGPGVVAGRAGPRGWVVSCSPDWMVNKKWWRNQLTVETDAEVGTLLMAEECTANKVHGAPEECEPPDADDVGD